MAIHPGTRPPLARPDSRQELRDLLRCARELPFETRDSHRWHRAVSSLAARIQVVLLRDGVAFTVREACSALVKDVMEIEIPSLIDVARVSDRLFEMQTEMAGDGRKTPREVDARMLG